MKEESAKRKTSLADLQSQLLRRGKEEDR
jgi:hypothetical protein